MAITPLPAALELYELKSEIGSCLASAYLFTDSDSLEARLMDLIQRLRAIDLKYPTNDNGIVKEQK